MRKFKDWDKEKKSDLGFVLIIIVVGAIVGICIYFAHDTYEVEVTYCDGREPKIIQVDAIGEPTNRDINTCDNFPKHEGEMYVCSIRTIRKISE